MPIRNTFRATGRTATYVVAASDAPANVKAQADQVLAGTNDQVAIYAELVTLNATGVRQKLSLVGILPVME